MDTRRQCLLKGLTPSLQWGLEIGPMDRPVVTRSMGKIIYVDCRTQDDLRRVWQGNPEYDVSELYVDAVWHRNRLKDAIGKGLLVHYVIASHVIEHCSDMVDWLGQIQEVLQADGSLRLAVPDKRYIFDVLREVSRPADIIAAHLRGCVNPNEASLIDFCLSQADWGGAEAWNQQARVDQVPRRSKRQALAEATSCLAKPDDVDCHCWTFTPYSFAVVMRDLAELGLISLRRSFHQTTTRYSNEFIVSLTPATSAADAVESWQAMADEEEQSDLLYTSRRLVGRLRELSSAAFSPQRPRQAP